MFSFAKGSKFCFTEITKKEKVKSEANDQLVLSLLLQHLKESDIFVQY